MPVDPAVASALGAVAVLALLLHRWAYRAVRPIKRDRLAAIVVDSCHLAQGHNIDVMFVPRLRAEGRASFSR
jgi:hypothetical protein